MKQTITTAVMAAVAFASTMTMTAENFIIDIDDASHVKFETGPYKSAYKEVTLNNGENTITVNGSDDYVITPKEGWLVESITAYDESGAVTDESPAGWRFDKTDDSYSIFYGSKRPAYRYVVKTKANVPVIYTLDFDINDASAVTGGTFRAGNQTVTVTGGKQTVTFNANKGTGFSMQLRAAVTEVTFLRNGSPVEPDNISNDGVRTYSFELGETETIDIDVVMETPEFFLDIDDPTHYDVRFPDMETVLTDLKSGRNKLTYKPNEELAIVAKEGWKIQGLSNMSFDSTTDKYTHRFKDGNGGIEFKATTVEYNPPIANVRIDMDDTAYMSFISVAGAPSIYSSDLQKGDNYVKLNLDKGNKLTLSFKTSYKDKFMVAADNEVLELTDDWYNLTTSVNYDAPGEYSIVIRTLKDGDYDGNVTYECTEDHKIWTLTFDPSGIIEKTDAAMPVITSSAKAEIMASGIAVTGKTAVITFTDEIETGNYTLQLPAGLFRINGNPSAAMSHNFAVVISGVDGIESDGDVEVRYFNLQGEEISAPADGEIVIVVNGNKAVKTLFRK